MTNSNPKHIADLLVRQRLGELTDDEQELFEEWLTNADNKAFFEKNSVDRSIWNFSDVSSETSQRILDKINIAEQNSTNDMSIHSKSNWKYWLSIASIFLLTVIGGILVLVSRSNNEGNRTHEVTQRIKDDFLPGGDKATLILSNGKTIDLHSASNGSLINEGDNQIINSNGVISYASKENDKYSEGRFNTLSTPRGGQYQVVLPDGSIVRLNAASSIRFPSFFTGGIRKVEITGEAYFNVAKNAAMPFIVKVKDQEILVLGTAFNVNAYDNEGSIRTTLVEGSIRIAPIMSSAGSESDKSLILKPGYQTSLSEGGVIQIKKAASISEVTAWTKGVFEFKNQNVESIFRQLSRWYNMEVVYEGSKPTGSYSGRINRNSNASIVLEVLRISGITYRIDQGRVIVSGKNK